MGYFITQKEIRELAKRHGWKEQSVKDPTVMIFARYVDNSRQKINVWWEKMTVGTYLKHPKWGKSQLFRRNVDRETLEKILENPRTHTKIGYYTKDQYREEIRR